MNQQEQKARKKAYQKAKKGAVRPWSIMTGISAPLMVIFLIAAIVVGMFDNTIVAMTGGSFWEVINGDENAVYYEMDYTRAEDMYKAGDKLCYQVEAEGATLLMNNGAAALIVAFALTLLCFISAIREGLPKRRKRKAAS